jgi:hypothetical protein
MYMGFLWEIQKERDNKAGQGYIWDDNVNIYLRVTVFVDWIRLVQDGNKWRVLVNTELNLMFPKRR